MGSPRQEPKRMYGPAQPGTGDSTLYTAPNAGARVTQIHIVNTDTVARTVSLAFGATAATAANCFLYTYSLEPKKTYDWTGEIAMVEADTIHGLQENATACTYIISGNIP